MNKWLAVALTLSLSVPALPTAVEDEAAFAASQAARAKGGEAFRAGDLGAALAAMEEALSFRPTHPGLLGNVAYLAASTGDGQRAAEVLRAYAALGLVPGEEIQAKVKEAVTPAAWQSLEAAFKHNTRTIGTADIDTPLPADLHLVEGIALATDGTMYVGTVVSGGIYRMKGHEATMVVDAKDHEFGSLFGMTMHDGSLYATFARVEQTPGYVKDEGQTGLAKINPTTGDVLKVWVLPDGTEGQQIADLTVTADGTIYVSDAQGKKIYRVEGDTLVAAFSHSGFMSPQGIVELKGEGLYLADYGRGIWKLDEKSGEATLMDTPTNASLLGIDGLVAHKGRLIAIQNGVNPQRIAEVHIDGDTITGITVLAQNLEGWDEPTLGVSGKDGIYYIAASQWPKYGESGAIRQGAEPPAATPVMLIRD
jgi:hypothetical protein